MSDNNNNNDKQRSFDGRELDPEQLRVARELGESYDAVGQQGVAAYKWLTTECEMEPTDDDFRGYHALLVAFDEVREWGLEVPPKALRQFAPIDPDDPWTHHVPIEIIETVDGETYWVGLLREDSEERIYGERAWVDDYGHVSDEEMFEYVGDDGGYLYNLACDDDPDAPVWMYSESFYDAHTLSVVMPGEESVIVRHYDGVIDVDAMYDLPRSVCAACEDIARGTGWVSTDAWRGYYDGPSETDRFVRVKSGWHSTMDGSSAQERINDVLRGDHYVPFPVIVAFARTSNVFSVGIDIYVPAENEEDFAPVMAGTSTGGVGGGLGA